LKTVILKKMTLVILGTALLTIMICGLLINLALNHQFQRYLTRMKIAQEDQIILTLTEIYRENNGWPREPIILKLNRALSGNLLYVTDSAGRMVILTRRGLIKKTFPKRLQRITPIFHEGKQIGKAYFGIDKIQNFLTRQNELFRRTINRSILLAVLLSSLVALSTAFCFARKLAAPIMAMNRIAKDISGGNLESRINQLPHDELGELGRSLNHLAERLSQVQNLRKQMTANVAHDLRTPLTTVRSHLEGMIDRVIPATPENLDSLLEEVIRLTQLIADLQEIAETDAAATQFLLEPIDLMPFLSDLTHKMAPLFAAKGIGLRTGGAKSLLVNADRKALGKILDNLLSNALKFTPAGKNVKVNWECRERQAIVTVADEGIGITPTDLPLIFERFYRADPSRHSDGGGFGLGLAIVKDLVTALGGEISVVSTPGVGSVFTVKLKLHDSHLPAITIT
jgi:two-component system sensor histidine kinase BaeS